MERCFSKIVSLQPNPFLKLPTPLLFQHEDVRNVCHVFFFLVAITMGNYNLYLGMSPRAHHLVCVFQCVHNFNLKNLSYFISKLPHDLLVIVCGSKECTQNLLTFCNTLYKKHNSNTLWQMFGETPCGIIIYDQTRSGSNS